MKYTAIVLAAGRGSRMNAQVQKQYLLLQELPVLYYALKAFEDSYVDNIILVTGRDDIDYCRREIVDRYHLQKVTQVIAGGKERYHSVYQGLCAAEDSDYVLIHDGARPFVSQDILMRARETLSEVPACAAGVPTKDTVKLVDTAGFVIQTPNRNQVWNIQTPQCFSYELVKKAYTVMLSQEEQLKQAGIAITDDAMVVEEFSDCRVKLFEGAYTNIKITTPEDMEIAEQFLGKKVKN